MPLVVCPDCERAISTLATACPNCGRPQHVEAVGATPYEWNAARIAGAVAAVAALVVFIVSTSRKQFQPPAPAVAPPVAASTPAQSSSAYETRAPAGGTLGASRSTTGYQSLIANV